MNTKKKSPELGLKIVPLKELKNLKFAPYNPKKFNSKQFNRLGMSIAEHGWTVPIVVNTVTDHLIDGNQRFKYALKQADEDMLIPVIYLAIKDLDEEKRLNVALNQSNTPVDTDMVFNLIKEVTKDPLIIDLLKEMEAYKKTIDAQALSPEYEIVQDADEKYDYVIALFDKGVDFLNVCNFFNLSTVYDLNRQRKVGLGRAIQGQKLLQLIDIANKAGITNIADLKKK